LRSGIAALLLTDERQKAGMRLRTHTYEHVAKLD
jgi:hypothetical protein